MRGFESVTNPLVHILPLPGGEKKKLKLDKCYFKINWVTVAFIREV